MQIQDLIKVIQKQNENLKENLGDIDKFAEIEVKVIENEALINQLNNLIPAETADNE